MTRMLRFVLLLVTIAWGAAAAAHAQAPAPSPTLPAGQDAPAPADVLPGDAAPATDTTTASSGCDHWRRDPTFRLGQDFVVRRGEAADDVVAVFGSVVVEGEVCEDMSVTLGDVRLAQDAIVHGSLVVVGGTLTVEPGARVDRELVLVGGLLEAPADFRAGRGHVVIGLPIIGDNIRGAVPYLTRGLLYGRLIVPDLLWVWWVTAVLLFVQLLIHVLFPHATGASAATIAERPLSTFAAGLLVLLLAGPIAALLAVTVIGIALLPVLIGAMAIAWMVGKIGVCRWIGTRVFDEDDPASRLQSTRSFLIGFVVIVIAYMIPVLGIIVWGLTGVLGLGAATLACIRAFRRENPPAPPRPGRATPDVPPFAAPAVHGPGAAPGVAPGVAPGAGQPPVVPADVDLQRSAAPDAFGMPPPAWPGAVPPVPPGAGTALPAGAAGDDRALLAFPRAGFTERAGAFVLDALIVGLTAHAVFDHNSDEMIVVLLVAYHVAFWLWKRTTIGGIICQLRVARVDGAPLRLVDALVRGVTAIFSLAAFGIGALWIIWDPERQSWHDKVAGTCVVRVPRHYPLP